MRAPLCAAESIPYAPPLTIAHSRSTNPAAKSDAMRTPYGVGFRVPTIASDFLESISISPLTINPMGGISRSLSAVGQSESSGVSISPPLFSRD